MINKEQAIMSLRPNIEWTMNGQDVENIEWITPNVEPLTEAEVAAEMARLQTLEDGDIAQKAQDRLDAIEHAKSLGFTDAMIKVMYPALKEA
jgi:hypothetical protein